MTSQRQSEAGFSAVELLISLFIAAVFIATSFQLFSVVTQDGHEARLRAKASSIASENIQMYKDDAPIPCTGTSTAATLSIPTSELPSASGNVVYSCPYGSGAETTRVTVNIQYGNPSTTIEASLDVTDE